MAQIVAGSEQAFEALMHRHLGPLHGYLMRKAATAADADEVAQEALLTLWQQAERFDPKRGALRPWLYRIARNRLVDRLRRMRELPLEDAPLEALRAEVDDPLEPSRLAPTTESLAALLKLLPARQREALALVYLQGFGQADAARIMGIERRALESLLARGRANLKARLGPSATVLSENAAP